jgi:hypothetical protein
MAYAVFDVASFARGRYVLVSPDARRQVVAGPDGLTYVVGAET